MTGKTEGKKYNHSAIGYFYFGISSASFVGLLGLLQVQQLDAFLIIFLICFSLLLPTSIINGALSLYTDQSTLDLLTRYLKYRETTLIIGIVLAFIGISTLVLHFSIPIGVLFIVTSLVSLIIFGINFK